MYYFLHRTTSANRSLPDIPKDKSSSSESRIESTPQDVIYEASETITDNLELYATVQDKGKIIFSNLEYGINDIFKKCLS